MPRLPIRGILGLAVVLAVLTTFPTSAHADPCTAPLPGRGTTFSGQVVYVGDGDSLCVGRGSDPRQWIEVRLADFYAPELQEPGGREARENLARVTRNAELVCRARNRSWDRIVATCSMNGRNLADLLRQSGAAEGGRGFSQR